MPSDTCVRSDRFKGTGVVGSTFRAFALSAAAFVPLSWCPSTVQAAQLTNAQIFDRPVMSRTYENQAYVLRDAKGSGTGLREDVSWVAYTLAFLKPSYVSGVIRLGNGTALTDTMIQDYNTIRSAVQGVNPNARFDVEISLATHPIGGRQPFASAAALTAMMDTVNAQLHPDGWWFDFYSDAQRDDPDWITAATSYAHARGQTVGGNVFGRKVPPNADAVSFTDNPVAGSTFGFDFDVKQIAALKASSPSTIILGHLNNNAQNGPTTESCVYIQQWTFQQRVDYLQYWASQQSVVGFKYMYPVFFPECPGAYAYDPLKDFGPSGHPFYNHLWRAIDAKP